MDLRSNFLLALLLVTCKAEHLSPVSKCDTECMPDGLTAVGECRTGLWRCKNGDESTAICTGYTGPTNEVCDGLDNDCDGTTDNNIPSTCTTACGTFMRTCVKGVEGCRSRIPKDEICNGIDDDCDGVADNNLPLEFCYSGNDSDLLAQFGDCHPGRYVCEYNVKVCRFEKLPTPELCDGVDNNCNGMIDEGASDCTSVSDFKVVLTWSYPNDVDLHFKHVNSGNSHISSSWGPTLYNMDCYYGNLNPNWDNDGGQDDPELDHDIIIGQGPETITLTKPSVLHKYTIGVHMYNYSASPNVVDATVKIYCNGLLKETLTHSFIRMKTMWVVGDMTFDTLRNCTFTMDGFELQTP